MWLTYMNFMGRMQTMRHSLPIPEVNYLRNILGIQHVVDIHGNQVSV